ncbi:hypothetical protein ACLB2K_026970 [Fragaria x ananassa]
MLTTYSPPLTGFHPLCSVVNVRPPAPDAIHIAPHRIAIPVLALNCTQTSFKLHRIVSIADYLSLNVLFAVTAELRIEALYSSMSVEIRQTFTTRVYERKHAPNPIGFPSNMLIIRLFLCKVTGSRPYNNRGAITFDAPCLEAQDEFGVILPGFLRLSARRMYRKKLAKILNSMHIPRVKHPTIIDKIFLAVEGADVPGPPFFCLMTDLTLNLIRPVPKVVNLECLGKVRLDSLEVTTREMCVVCRDGLHHFEGAETTNICTDEQQLMITRLPCGHLYHGDCIVEWSKMSHLCPLCRNPMPTLEEEVAVAQADEPSKPPGWRLNWPMILTVSSGGLLASIYSGLHILFWSLSCLPFS